jgi:hypothetical protein
MLNQLRRAGAIVNDDRVTRGLYRPIQCDDRNLIRNYGVDTCWNKQDSSWSARHFLYQFE